MDMYIVRKCAIILSTIYDINENEKKKHNINRGGLTSTK